MRIISIIILSVATTASADVSCTIKGLAWLAGSWSGTSNGVTMEEVWTEPRGGMLLGLHRDSKGENVMFEFLRIAKDEGDIVYWASPRGAEATGFRLSACGESSATFENPDHDYPKKILYWIDDDGRLHARIEGATDSDPKNEWIWERDED